MKNRLFRYCPACGDSLGRRKYAKLITCQTCGFYFYRNPSPCVAVILTNNKNEILLVKRKFPPQKNYWDLPGGFVDFNENFENALVREIKEELNINLRNYFYFGSVTDIYPYKGIIYETIIAVYFAKIEEKIIPGDDVSDFLFFKKKDFSSEHFAFTGLAEIIKKYIKSENTS